MKNIATKWWIIGFVVFIISLFGLQKFLQNGDPDVITSNGLHSHPQLAIYVKGEQQEIPANIGIGAVHQPTHTHTEDADQGIIHLEFGDIVRNSDIKLGKFFEVWGKDIRSFGSNMTMTVNGETNTEYENYMMRDGDKIELHYD